VDRDAIRVSLLVTTTAAPATAAPDRSPTDPEIRPVLFCASAPPAKVIANASAEIRYDKFNLLEVG
jgi:hypothetical protein